MATFTLNVILGVLMIIGGFSLISTPLITFMSTGYFIIILFFIWGLYGIFQGISEKRYDKHFFISILSLILGIIGLTVPGIVEMNNSILLYMAAGWLLIRGVLSIIDAISSRKECGDAFTWVFGILLGVIELILAIISILNPALLAINLGLLIGFYYIESGFDRIADAKKKYSGGNSTSVLFIAMGVLTVLGGISMISTPLLTYLGTGPCIIMLFFIVGILGIIRAIMERSYKKEFFLSILCLILGIIGLTVPGIAEMNNSILLYMAAGWFLVHGVMSIIDAIASRKECGDTLTWVISILLGVIELVLAIISILNPTLLAINLGLLIDFYFIESGINMILVGAGLSASVAVIKAQQKA